MKTKVLSMTGFGSAETRVGKVSIYCQIRSVNHRYFEWKPRIPLMYQSIESDMKAVVQKTIQRGTLEVTIRRIERDHLHSKNLEATLVDLVDSFRKLGKKLGLSKDSMDSKLLDWALQVPHVFDEEDLKECSPQEKKAVESILQKASHSLLEQRQREGVHLAKHCQQCLHQMSSLVDEAEKMTTEIPRLIKAKVQDRISKWEMKSNLDSSRLESEVAFLADRADVSEEIVRLRAHLGAMGELLESNEAKGKKLEFMTQELHREVNTLGSKINDCQVAFRVVDLKSLVEQLREQVQNIE